MVENLHTPNCIRTRSGRYVNVFEPEPDMFLIEDIAHALAHQCRFSGHLHVFYSVAQHSVHVSERVPTKLRRTAMLHDASEAYLLDIPTPIKKNLPGYKDLENQLMAVLAKRFDFQWPLPPEIKHADAAMLQLEWDHLMISPSPQWPVWSPQEAKSTFLAHYASLS